MKVLIEHNLCDKCGSCVSICPNLAIDISENIVEINQSKCSKCLTCLPACPLGAIINVADK